MQNRQAEPTTYRTFTLDEARVLNEARTILAALAKRAFMGQYGVPESTADGMIAARAEVAEGALFQVLNHVDVYGGWPEIPADVVHNREPKQTVAVVFDTESDPPEPLGTYEGASEDEVCFTHPNGLVHRAPQDCVTVVPVAVHGASGPQATA